VPATGKQDSYSLKYNSYFSPNCQGGIIIWRSSTDGVRRGKADTGYRGLIKGKGFSRQRFQRKTG
jgi:hypothetical protein